MDQPFGGSKNQPAAPLTGYAWLSILAAIVTIAMKTEAYRRTGSVGLLSDAAESLINLVAAVFTLLMLSFAAQPADEEHPFGHGKAEYFASGFEGTLILAAALAIAGAAVERLQHPQPMAALDLGIAISAAAAAVNLAVASALLRAGKRHHSIALEADARHLLSDVWTTGAILLALGGVLLTGWDWLDPLIALLAAAQIAWSGYGLLRRSVGGLLDTAFPALERARVEAILERYRQEGIEFHELRTRVAGIQRFMTVHVLVPGEMSVQRGHELLERIEGELTGAIPRLVVVTHLEPLEDRASFLHGSQTAPEPWAADPAPGADAAAAATGRSLPARAGLWGTVLLLIGSSASLLLPDPSGYLALTLILVGLSLKLRRRRRPGPPLS